MATFTATRGAAGFPVSGNGPAGDLKRAWGTIAVAANPTAADIYRMCWVPNGATVHGGYLLAEDMYTGTETLDMNCGWAANGSDAADPDGFGNFGVWSGDTSVHIAGASVYLPFSGVLLTAGPKTFAGETAIEVVCVVTAATFAAGQLSCFVDYTV